jgi:hypothetical protein
LRGESPNDTETSPALDALCTRFGLSPFERWLVLLCAGVELDGEFANRCAAAPGSGGNSWPSLASPWPCCRRRIGMRWPPDAPLRHWRLIEIVGNGALVANRLQIDQRILFFLTGVSQIDERLVSLVAPLGGFGRDR